jgi:hypothetical protein
MPPHALKEEEIRLLRDEIELLMNERRQLLQVTGAAAVFVANLDTDTLPDETDTIDAAEMLAEQLNGCPKRRSRTPWVGARRTKSRTVRFSCQIVPARPRRRALALIVGLMALAYALTGWLSLSLFTYISAQSQPSQLAAGVNAMASLRFGWSGWVSSITYPAWPAFALVAAPLGCAVSAATGVLSRFLR